MIGVLRNLSTRVLRADFGESRGFRRLSYNAVFFFFYFYVCADTSANLECNATGRETAKKKKDYG